MADRFQVDQPLPNLSVRTAGGTPTTLAAYLGKQGTFVIFLHGTWCAECVGEFHRLQRYRADIEATGAKVVVVTHDTPEVLAGFLASTQPSIAYTVLADSEHTSGIGDDSMALVVDGSGIVRWLARWTDHRDHPSHQTILSTLHDIGRPAG